MRRFGNGFIQINMPKHCWRKFGEGLNIEKRM